VLKPDAIQRGIAFELLSRFERRGLAAVVEGPNAIAVVRSMVGSTRPQEATEGSIRGDYALVGLRNLVHASDAPETAAAEIKLWFPDGVVEYTRDIDRWTSEDKAPS